MNWILGFVLWTKGVIMLIAGLFIFCLISSFTDGSPAVFLFGLILLFVALFVSWPAIIVYSLWLWLVKQLAIPAKAGLSITVVIAPFIAVKSALWFFTWLGKDDMTSESFLSKIAFWCPLACCAIAIILCRKDLLEYLQPSAAIAELSTEQNSIV